MNRSSIILSGVMALAFSGCGGGGSSGPTGTPTPVPTPTPQQSLARTVIDTRNWDLRGGAGTFYNQDRLPEGTLDATLEWQNGANNVMLFVTDTACPGASTLLGGGCQVFATSRDPGQKPRQLTYTVPANQSVSVWVVNGGRTGESGTLEVGLTSRERPASPAPNATPTPTDIRNQLPDGPVVSAFAKVRSIETDRNFRNPFQDRDGFWILYLNEFVVFDLTQRNAGNLECKWVNDPTWTVSDDKILRPRGSSQPFLLRVDVPRTGDVEVFGMIDGVKSNVLNIRVLAAP